MNARAGRRPSRSLTLVASSQDRAAAAADGGEVLTLDELRALGLLGFARVHLLRYSEARFLAHTLGAVPAPLKVSVALRLLSHGRCAFVDGKGTERRLTLPVLLGLLRKRLAERRSRRRLLEGVAARVVALWEECGGGSCADRVLDLTAPAVYLRTDLVFEVRAGGAVAHTSGVLNALPTSMPSPIFLTTAPVACVDSGIETHVIVPDSPWWDFGELSLVAFGETFLERAESLLRHRPLAFVYQRHSVNNHTGLELACRARVPFVLEYNGSEVWVGRNWGSPLRYEAVAERIEDLNLHCATLVVVVSRALRDQLVGRGVAEEKILINPNGVDTGRYRPDVDGNGVRLRYGLGGHLVVGFIGTFGRWHGAEVLARAFVELLAAFPEARDRVRLFLIGDGLTMPLVREILSGGGATDLCRFAGVVPQEDGPAHLAACDVLVSPHVPNPDGSAFFGSPTKLFEYMAMGRAIVASDLDQLGEVLEHGVTAWLVPPADPSALASAIRRLIEDPQLCRRLGEAARQRAVRCHSWRAHVMAILDALAERCR